MQMILFAFLQVLNTQTKFKGCCVSNLVPHCHSKSVCV